MTAGGALYINGVASSGHYSQGGYNANYSNILLKGDSTYGVSGITFMSYKGSTNINSPSDVGFIQYHAHGVTQSAYNVTPTEASSGERTRLVIGVGNDADNDSNSVGEQLWLQTAGGDDLKHLVTGSGLYNIITSRNISSQTVANATNCLPRNTNSSVLPEFSSYPPYLLGIEAFSAGGTVKWKGWESCRVGYASSAGSVSWSNVTGKPSTFTPSDHSHSYLPLSGGYMDGNINCNYEYAFIGYMPRMYNGGGGWAYDVVAIRNPSNNRILNLGVFGGEASLSYVYLSPGGGYSGSGFRVDTSGNCTATGNMYANSDRHLKKNISSIPTSSLERLFNVSDKLLKKYTLKQTGKESYGFIAQELEQYIPEAVTVNDPNNMKSVSYNVAFTKIIAALVQKMKSMDKDIEKLKKR